jgi:2-hydroxy-3-keto-5-methylthiopentenyl-1-phosphate phosphatase
MMPLKSEKVIIMTDFDGTACSVDLGNEILNKFATTSLNDIEMAYVKGKIGSRIAYERIAARLKGSLEKMLDHVLTVEKLDPFFPEFCSLSKNKGIDIRIVSDGLDFYIEAILKKYKLMDVQYYSNVAVFGADSSLSIHFPAMNELCTRCGTCKSRILNSYRLIYDKIIYIGDGYSDFCPSRYADMVFAKKILFQRCAEEGTPCVQFEDFSEINRFIARNF